jgi:hypothetical protein
VGHVIPNAPFWQLHHPATAEIRLTIFRFSAAIGREKMREVLGSELIRELVLK